LAPGFGRQGGDLSFVKYAGPNAIYPISSGLVNPKYLNGKTPLEAAIGWQTVINAAADNYEMKSMSELFVEDLIGHGILKIAPNADAESWFLLKNGTKSPLYWDVRAIQSYPDLLKKSSYLLQKKIKESGVEFDRIASVPYGALGLGYGVAYDLGAPVVTPRKEGAKDHGDRRDIVGAFKERDRAVIIEDVATSGESTLETAAALRANNLDANDVFVLIDREQGAVGNLAKHEIRLRSVLTQSDAIKKMDGGHPMRGVVMDYLDRSRQK
jgi:orotate phosphoribosyltransferase